MRILITGGSTGIGAACARHLAAGNQIIVHYHQSAEAVEQVAADIAAAGGEAELVQADLSSSAGCETLFKSVAQGPLDVLVNNAGGLIKRQAADALEWDFMEETFRLNTFSAMKMSALCIPLLKQSDNGNIIMMTSVAARHGAPTATLYGASKGALDSFTRGLAKEAAPEIRVNAIAPGVIETPFHEKVSTPEQLANWRESSPLKRNGKALDIAQAVSFIIENNFLTGETIDINGGLHMR